MNSRQKEILKQQLANEEQQLKRLQKIYKDSLKDIQEKLAAMMGRDDADLQHVIYQVNYQKQLDKMIGDELKKLKEKQYSSVQEYIDDCYTNGFTGVMYDLHGQGVPMITPIDQKKMKRAISVNSKIKTTLYKKMGQNVTTLKRRITAAVSRGVAAGKTYSEVAKDLTKQSGVGLNNTMRIARTEGHRVAQEAALDAQHAAKDEGADIVKQWDAALDSRTRPEHAQLDGQIREIDEPFDVNGMEAQSPSGFGKASQDINCRCAILQRAKWALEEDELHALKQRADYYGLDKTKDIEDFKSKYLKAADK